MSKYEEFKEDFHRAYVRARKDPQQKWFDLPYLAMDDATQEVIKRWSADWHSLFDLAAGSSTEKKEAAKQVVQKLAEKRRKEAEEKARLEKEHAAKQ